MKNSEIKRLFTKADKQICVDKSKKQNAYQAVLAEMEIQTIQSALAGIKRINEFLELSEKNKYDGTKSRLVERVDSEEKEGKDKGENISGN